MTIADAPHPILPGDEVRYVGQPVALVLADSRAAAIDAAALVDVDYEPFDAAPDVLLRFERTAGDVDGAFADAAHVVRARHAIPARPPRRSSRAASSPSRPARSGSPRRTRTARATRSRTRWAIEPRVILPEVGGAFGSKGTPGPEIAAVAAAALRIGRPVKWVETRTENFLTAYQGRGMEAEVELALDADGRMLAVRAHITADLGAYLYANSAAPPHTTAMLMCGCYTIPAASVRVTGMRTDKVPTGPCRGAGRPEAAAFLELTVDQAARELGLDPLELRRRNLVRSFPHETPLGWVYDSGDYERCMDLAASLVASDDDGLPTRLAGTGLALYVERAGGQFEEARVAFAADGRVIAHSGAGPHGQGHATTFAQIVADALGVEPEAVELRFGDSDTVPDGIGTFASRSTAMAGSALHLAARRLRERLDAGERPPLEAHARFESDLVFGSGAYAAAVEIDARDRRAARQAPRRRRRRGHDRQPAARRGPGPGRRRARARRRARRGDRPRRGRPAARRLLRRLPAAHRGRRPGDPRGVRAIALAAQPARRQGNRRGRHDRRAGGDRQRDFRCTRRHSRRSALHAREALAGGRSRPPREEPPKEPSSRA